MLPLLSSDRDTWSVLVDVAQVVTAVAAIAVPFIVYGLVFLRRPKVSLHEDPERIHSRLEGTDNAWPHVRILASNSRRRRAAHSTQVIVIGYRKVGDPRSAMVTLGSPALGWPSANAVGAALTIHPGMARPVDLGSLYPIDRSPKTGLVLTPPVTRDNPVPKPHPFAPPKGTWHLRLGIELAIADYREFIPPGEWTISLVVGADDGPARSYEIDVAWDGDERDPKKALSDLLDHLAVREG